MIQYHFSQSFTMYTYISILFFLISPVFPCGKPPTLGGCNIHTRAECREACARRWGGNDNSNRCCAGTAGDRGDWATYCRQGNCIRQFGG